MLPIHATITISLSSLILVHPVQPLHEQITKLQEELAAERLSREVMDERKTKEIKSVESSISLDLTVEKRVRFVFPPCPCSHGGSLGCDVSTNCGCSIGSLMRTGCHVFHDMLATLHPAHCLKIKPICWFCPLLCSMSCRVSECLCDEQIKWIGSRSIHVREKPDHNSMPRKGSPLDPIPHMSMLMVVLHATNLLRWARKLNLSHPSVLVRHARTSSPRS